MSWQLTKHPRVVFRDVQCVKNFPMPLSFFSECELGPIVNRDLSRRIRTVSGLTVDKKVVRNDIRLAAKVITNLDKRWDIWTKEQPEGVAEIKKVTSNV